MGGFASHLESQRFVNDPVLNIFQPSSQVEEPQLEPMPEGEPKSYCIQPDAEELAAAQPAPWQAPRLAFAKVGIKDRGAFFSRNGELPDHRKVPMAQMKGYKKEESDENVRYLRDLKILRSKYEVSIGATMRRRGEIFDTAKIRAFYDYKRKGGNDASGLLSPQEKARPFDPQKARALPAHALMGKDKEQSANFKDLAKEWEGSLIWVCATEQGRPRPVFYSSIGKQTHNGAQGFKHSSFKAGGNVVCAGEWIVSNGKLLKISANSGHYRPSIDHLHRGVLFMSESWNKDTVVLLWNIKADKWEEVPVLLFRDNPSLGGAYRAHPIA